MADPSAHGTPRRRFSWTTRILAPLALIAALGALYVIVTSSHDDGGSGNDSVKAKSDGHGKGGKKSSEGDEKKAKTYVIQDGDSLSTIAEKFNVTVDDLERLNADADIDPQALVAGQELKIR